MWLHNKGCGGWKNFKFTRHKFLLVTVKEWLKPLLTYRSYPKNKTGYPFFGPPCIHDYSQVFVRRMLVSCNILRYDRIRRVMTQN